MRRVVTSHEKYADNQYYVELDCGHNAHVYYAVGVPPTTADCTICDRKRRAPKQQPKRAAAPAEERTRSASAAPSLVGGYVNAVEEHLIHQSFNRPQLLIGGDRPLVVSTAMACGLCGIALGSAIGILICLLVWFAILAALQRMAKADPIMRQVYVRHVRYTAYYPAKSGAHARAPQLPVYWKG